MHITWPATKQAKQEMKASKVYQIDTTIQLTKLIMTKKPLTFCKCQPKGHNFLYSWHRWSVHSISVETLFYKEQTEFRKKKKRSYSNLTRTHVTTIVPTLSASCAVTAVIVNSNERQLKRASKDTCTYKSIHKHIYKDILHKWGKENQCYTTSQVKVTNFLNLSKKKKKRKPWKEDFK